MIKYTLQCKNLHQFDSWFASSEAFDKLKNSNLLSCEVCGDTSISKSLMAPSVKSKKGQPNKESILQDTIKGSKFIQEFKKKVEKSCEYVGDKFAEEARAMHDGESPERSIYGKTTEQEAKSLLEEGIPVMPLPWHDRRNSN
ncbi:MAG: hypothetical protein CML37_00635 [Rhodobacteraceae bacterium]|nr:hypothetical protein [Paracoccaceae bacterium]|tara:strand:+ start:972 stop:1397 length:426 start_codon:yes stop_codon:yes gene_type:complete